MSVVGLRLTCAKVRCFSPSEAGGHDVEVVCSVYALRIEATGGYVEDAENVLNVWIELLEAKMWKFFISVVTAISLSNIIFCSTRSSSIGYLEMRVL